MNIISKEKVSEELSSLVQSVSHDYELRDWRVELWDIKGENECIDDMKLIYLDKDDIRIEMWFLHEVAHALLPNDENSRFHRDEWKSVYKSLLTRYNVENENDPYTSSKPL